MRKQKRSHLFVAICLMLSIVITAMTGLEPAQAAKIRPQVSTMDLQPCL